MRWQILPICDYENFAQAWDELNERSFRSPVLCSAFVGPLIAEFSSGNEVIAVLTENNQSKIMAMGVFRKANLFAWESFQPSQAPLGLWLCDSAVAVTEALSELACCLGRQVLMLGVLQQDPDLFPQFSADNVEFLDYIETARVSVKGSFDDYWSQRGKNLRHNMKRQRNRLEKEGIIPELRILDKPEDIQSCIAEYGELETKGWKSDLGTAINLENSQGRFYQAALENMCRNGSARVYKYYYGDKIVCLDLCVHMYGTLIILKTTYDEEIKTSSPAFLMRQEIFRKIFENNTFEKIEFYGKVMDWHTKWSDEIRSLYHINWYKSKYISGVKNNIKSILKK